MTPPRTTSDVSVVIPCFNAAGFVAGAIRSALNQTHPPAEIIVVDDGSTDATPAVVAAFGDQVVLHRQPNAGPGAARNTGIGLSRCRFIAFLDGDDLWEPDKLARQLAALHADPAAVLCHTQMRLIDARGTPGDLGWGGTYRTYADLLLGCGVCTSSVLARREPLFSAGLFDPFRRAAEDYDLWLRITRFGPMLPLADPLVRYRWHDQNASKNYLRTHRQITEIMTRHLQIARGDKNTDHAARARRGLRRTRQSSARQALAAAAAARSGNSLSVLRHLLAALRLDPSGTLGDLWARARARLRFGGHHP